MKLGGNSLGNKVRFSKNYTIKNLDSGLKIVSIEKESKVSIRQHLKKSSLDNVKEILEHLKNSDSCVIAR